MRNVKIEFSRMEFISLLDLKPTIKIDVQNTHTHILADIHGQHRMNHVNYTMHNVNSST